MRKGKIEYIDLGAIYRHDDDDIGYEPKFDIYDVSDEGIKRGKHKHRGLVRL